MLFMNGPNLNTIAFIKYATNIKLSNRDGAAWVPWNYVETRRFRQPGCYIASKKNKPMDWKAAFALRVLPNLVCTNCMHV